MPLFGQCEVGPHRFDLFGRQIVGSGSDLRESVPCPVNGFLPVLNDPVERFGVNEVFEPAVEGGVAFGFGNVEKFGGGGDFTGIVKVFGSGPSDTFEEQVDDEWFDLAGTDRDGVGARTGVLAESGFTSVVEGVTGRSLAGFHGVPAGSAPENAGQKSLGSSGSGWGDAPGGVRGFEGGPVNNGFMPGQVDDSLATVDFPKVGAVSDQMTERTNGPAAGGLVCEPVSDFRPRFTGCSSIKCFLNDGGFSVRLELAPSVFRIAERDGAAHVNASADSVRSGVKPVFSVPMNLKLGYRRHDRRDHSACPTTRVNAFRNGEQGGIMFGENVQEFPQVGDGSSEPVKFRNNDPFGFTCFDALNGLVKSWSVPFFAGLVQVFKDLKDRTFVKGCPSFDCFALFGRGDKVFSLPSGNPTYADVSVSSHRPLAYSALLSVRCKTLTGFWLGNTVFANQVRGVSGE